jgi:hypothetical protein
VRATQRDRRIALLERQVFDLIVRLRAVEDELARTRRAQRQAATIVELPRRWEGTG